MSLELIKKFLKENGKGSPELSEAHIDAAIEQARTESQEAEKARYIAEAKKIRADIDKFKPFKAVIDELGFTGTVEELPAFVESLKKSKESGADGGKAKTELEKQVAALSNQLKSLAEENRVAKEREVSLQRERKSAILREKLMKDVGEKLIGGDARVQLLIHEGTVDLDEDGKTIVFKNGDLSTPYETGVKNLLKTFEADLKDNQRAGAGTAAGAGRPKADPNMSLSDMLKLK